MHWGQRKMHSNMTYLLVISCMICILNGCTSNTSKTTPSIDNKTSILQAKEVDTDKVKKIDTFKTENADVLLQGSKELPHSDNVSFTPLALNDQGDVFGESIMSDGTVSLYKLNVDTEKYQKLFQAEKGETIGVSGATNDYVLFSVVNQGNVAMNYCMNLHTLKNNVLTGSSPDGESAIMGVAFQGDFAYFSKFNINAPLIKYDMKHHKQEIIDKEKVADPIVYQEALYYIKQYYKDDNLSTEIIQYNINTKKKHILAQGNEKDGNFSNLTTDGTSLIVNMHKGQAIDYFYKIVTSPVKLIPYFKGEISSFKGYNGYFTWMGSQENDEQVHKPYTLFDSKKNIVYKYNGSLIYVSNKGVLWVKYTKKENEIPKGEIFTKDNSVLMWHSFS